MSEIVNLMIGTSPDTKGGISTVVKAYQDAGFLQKQNIIYITTHQDGTKSKKLYTALTSYYKYFVTLFCYDVNILHIHIASRASFWRKSLFIMIGRLFNKRIIFHLHGGEFKLFIENELHGLRKWFALKIINMADVIITLSESWEQWVLKTVNKPKVICIHNSIYPIPINKSMKRKSAQLLFLGKICAAKGALDLIQALTSTKLKNINLRLVMGGDGDIDNAKQLVKKYQLEDKVEFIGWISGEQKDQLLQESSILILPSYNEGMPMSILEALSAGLPIISTTVGGIPQQVTNGVEGYLITPGDISLLSERIYQLLTDIKKQQEMSNACIKKFNTYFSIFSAIPKLENIYQEIGH